MSNQSIFITGTDTAVGKTTITGALLLALQQHEHSVGVMKPIETGIAHQDPEHSDTERLRKLLSPSPPFDSVCLYAFPHPLAPLAAARKANKQINCSHITSSILQRRQQYSRLFIEGAGGLFTPVTPKDTIRDLITYSKSACVLVGRTSLGGVNHCLLTIDALQRSGIRLLGIVLNEPCVPNANTDDQEQQESTVTLIREWTSVPVFGPIPFNAVLETNWREGITTLSKEPEIQRLAAILSGTNP